MRTRALGVALVVAAALGTPGPATAHDHRAPEAVLVTEMGSGAGTNYSSTWSDREGRLCGIAVADGIRAWGSPPVPWMPGTDMAVRLGSRHRPTRVRALAYVVGDPTSGTPIYGEFKVPYELRPVEVDGKRMWEAVLEPPPSLDLYLDVVVQWKDRDGCGVQQSAWTFRAGLLPI